LRILLFSVNILFASLILLPLVLLKPVDDVAESFQEIIDTVFALYVRVALFSIGFWVRHHGHKPQPSKPHIFVSNHTTVMDYALASSKGRVHAVVAQGHGGVFGIVQRLVLHPLTGSLTFDRNESRDRVLVSKRMQSHVHDLRNKPLLVFPEGTCVNNEFTVLFHKGAFELDSLVCPIAIKYSKYYGDPYFNTREQTFTAHLVYLMTRWCMVADVYWIEAQECQDNESKVQFANRVKGIISSKARLKNLSWDGYLKNYRPTAEKQDKMRSKTKEEYDNDLRRKVEHLRRVNAGDYQSTDPSALATPGQHSAAYELPGWLSDESRTKIQNEIIRNSLQDQLVLLRFYSSDSQIVASQELIQDQVKDADEKMCESASSSFTASAGSVSETDEKLENTIFEMN